MFDAAVDVLGYFLLHASPGPGKRQGIAAAALGNPQFPGLAEEFNELLVVNSQHRLEAEVVRFDDVAKRSIANRLNDQIGALRTFEAWQQLTLAKFVFAAVQLVIIAVDR